LFFSFEETPGGVSALITTTACSSSPGVEAAAAAAAAAEEVSPEDDNADEAGASPVVTADAARISTAWPCWYGSHATVYPSASFLLPALEPFPSPPPSPSLPKSSVAGISTATEFGVQYRNEDGDESLQL
jgi:hypothetical protein